MLRKTTLACSLVASTFAAGVAAADEAATSPTASSPTTTPVRFTSLAPDGLQSEINTRLGLHFLDGADETLFSIQLDGQFVAPSGMGGYARISGAKVEEVNGLGDLEVGGLYRIDRGATAVTIRGGLSLPTASEDFESFFTNYFAVLMSRPSDLISAVPEVTALRMSVAPSYRTGNIVLRGDFGFDVAVDSPGESNLDPLYHADIGIGVQSGLVAGTAELATIGSTGSEDEGTFHALSLGAQYDLGSVTPHATLAIPFDSEGSDSIEGYSLLVGLSGGL